MKILPRSRRRDVWHGNELQQVLRGGTDVRRIDRIPHTIKLKLLAGRGIENLYRGCIVISCRRKIPPTFRKCRNRREEIIRRAASRPIPSCKEKPFVAAIEDFRNVQRSADICSESGGVVTRLVRGNPGQRIRSCIQKGIVILKI